MQLPGARFGPISKIKKSPPRESFLYSSIMELSNSNIKKFLILQETETLKIFLIFSQKKASLIFLEMETPKIILYKIQEELPNLINQNLSYFSRKSYE